MNEVTIMGYAPQSALAGGLILIGVLLIVIAGIGIIRMPDLFLRMSVSTKAATLGLALVLLGTAIHFWELGVSTRAVATILFVFLTAPVAAHMIGRAAYADGVPLWEKTAIDELQGQYERSDRRRVTGDRPVADEAEENGLA